MSAANPKTNAKDMKTTEGGVSYHIFPPAGSKPLTPSEAPTKFLEGAGVSRVPHFPTAGAHSSIVSDRFGRD
jgi:hypothetical protein